MPRAPAAADGFVWEGLEALPARFRGAVVALGNFDGVHRGHQVLLAAAVARARAEGVPAVVLTFEPHPRTLFHPEAPVFRLTPPAEKAELLAALGLDGVVVVRFDRAFAALTAEAFVAEVLAGRLAARAVVAGYDFHFGRGRGGSPEFLAAEAPRHGIAAAVVGAVTDLAEPISASAIRERLEEGDVAAAERLLGYRWFVAGTVAGGDRRGRELGYPTANLALPPDCRLRHGIYAVRLRRADGAILDGVASYGRRPTFDNGAPLFEAHAFDFSGDLYGERLTVTLFGWIRGEERFESAAALIARMDRDSAAARRILADAGPGTALDRRLGHG